jgi:acyl carrier protein
MTDVSAAGVDEAFIRAWMVRYIRQVLNLPGDVDSAAQFDAYGLDSVEAVIMAGVMEEEFRVVIDPMEMFEHPTIERFTTLLAARVAERA